jgi:hypothetical protein
MKYTKRRLNGFNAQGYPRPHHQAEQLHLLGVRLRSVDPLRTSGRRVSSDRQKRRKED